jgi:hypothetical protein
LIVTSNRAMEEWNEIFGDDLIANAAIDCLSHHVQIPVNSHRQSGVIRTLGFGKSLVKDIVI